MSRSQHGLAASATPPGAGSTFFRGLERAATERYFKIACLIFLVAAAARILVSVLFVNIDPATANLWEYGDFAKVSLKYGALVRNMARMDETMMVVPTGFMPPVPVFLWMGVFWLFGVTKTALAVMVALNIALGVVIVHYTMRVATTLFNSAAVSLIAGAFIAVNPVFVFSVVTYHAVNLYLVLLLMIFDLTSSRFRPSLGKAALIGLLIGIAVLARTEYLLLGGAMLLGSLLHHRQLRPIILSGIVAGLVVIPWTVRNYLVLGHFIPVANSTGYNLYKGFNPTANGSGHWADTHGVRAQLHDQIAAVPYTRDYESDVDKVMKDAAIEYIKEHPVESFVYLPIEKITLFWFFDYHDPTATQLLYQAQFWPLFVLSIIGLVRAARSRLFQLSPDHRTVLLIFIVETITMAAYAVHARYRMNVEPFLFCYAASALWAMLQSRFGAAASHSPGAVE